MSEIKKKAVRRTKSSSESAGRAQPPEQRSSELDSATSSQLSFLDFKPAPAEVIYKTDPKILELVEKVKSFSTNQSSPLEALNEISKWQKNL
jgi:DNA-binding transcriptional regulator GbsR (MarR family)